MTHLTDVVSSLGIDTPIGISFRIHDPDWYAPVTVAPIVRYTTEFIIVGSVNILWARVRAMIRFCTTSTINQVLLLGGTVSLSKTFNRMAVSYAVSNMILSITLDWPFPLDALYISYRLDAERIYMSAHIVISYDISILSPPELLWGGALPTRINKHLEPINHDSLFILVFIISV